MASQHTTLFDDQHAVAATKHMWETWALISKSVFSQLAVGIVKPVVSFSQLAPLTEDGIATFKMHLEMCTGTNFQFIVNSVDDIVTLIPVAADAVDTTAHVPAMTPSATTTPSSISVSEPTQMSSDATDEQNSNAAGPVNTSSVSTTQKVPRPANSFILYRQHWHPKIVAEQPTLSNNEISKIIGKKWSEEAQVVKDQYKRTASELKAKHAIEHPEYRYQPRKPSEKKKRMTKTKMAKLRAQSTQKIDSNILPDLTHVNAAHNIQPWYNGTSTGLNTDESLGNGVMLDVGYDINSAAMLQDVMMFNANFDPNMLNAPFATNDQAVPINQPTGAPTTASQRVDSHPQSSTHGLTAQAGASSNERRFSNGSSSRSALTPQTVSFDDLQGAYAVIDPLALAELERQKLLQTEAEYFNLDEYVDF